jgi:DNA-binding response OmpR family regulator
MPYMDGRQLFSAVRSLKNFGRVPFIIYTGSDSEGNELELLGLGVSDFISKTRGVRVVVERIEHELRKGTE